MLQQILVEIPGRRGFYLPLNYPIQPQHIDTDFKQRFGKTFRDEKTGEAVRLIMMFCQWKEGWVSFTQAEIDEFNSKKFKFHKLLNKSSGYIVEIDQRFYITHHFISHCFKFHSAVA